jgi:hypothetical protein
VTPKEITSEKEKLLRWIRSPNPSHAVYADESVRRLCKELSALRAENDRLRAALANSQSPCAYCSLPKEQWAECKSGFPGCGRSDDAMGCQELGASLEADALRAERDRLLEAINQFESQLCDGDCPSLMCDGCRGAVRNLAAHAKEGK